MKRAHGRSQKLLPLFAVFVGLIVLASPQAVAQSLPQGYEVFTFGGEHFWISWATQELGTLKAPVTPVAVFGQDGEVTVKEMPVSDPSLASISDALVFGGDCSGGQCAGGGTVLDCPSSGTTCGSEEVCACQCEQQGNGSYSAVHRCEELQLH